MGKFNKEKFGNKLRSARLQNGLSLEYVAKKLGKSHVSVIRYEKGEVIPNAETLNTLCEIYNIYNGDLYNITKDENIVNLENSNNPFKVNKLYLYYKGYIGKRKLGKFKFVIDIEEKSDFVEVRISDYKSKKTILIGHMLADDNIATIRTENYKPNCPRLETNQIIINISDGTNHLLLGTMLCTNGNYIPNMKKCLISKKDLVFTDEMFDMLKCTEEEKENILRDDIWLADIEKVNEFEYKEE